MMNSNIYFTDNDLEILDFITDAGIKHDDDNTSRVFSFFLENYYNLVLYFATKDDKGFIMFRINNIKENKYELVNLKKLLLELLNSGDNVKILKEAIAQVEKLELVEFTLEIFNKKKT